MSAPSMELCEAVAAYARLLWERGWVANHDGNVSVRLDEGRFLATPTAESKRCITPEMLVVVDAEGRVLEGRRRIFSEWNLHAAWYRARPDLRAILHSHAPHATAAGVTGTNLDTGILPEAVVSLGTVPTARRAMPGPAAAEALAAVAEADAVLLPGNGVVTGGDDLEQAYLRMELVEHLAQITLLARARGRPRTVTSAERARLLERRARAGLGPEGRARRGHGGGASPTLPPSRRTARVARAAAGGPPARLAAEIEARAQALTGDARLAREITREVLARLGRGGS
ncbi:MAG: class II aldolase/adducin family protein [Deltaproteobacteria bacterium]|nr:MAG: class II aldolase/adducin family protein [Deltaproteobacteria bacterium]